MVLGRSYVEGTPTAGAGAEKRRKLAALLGFVNPWSEPAMRETRLGRNRPEGVA